MLRVLNENLRFSRHLSGRHRAGFETVDGVSPSLPPPTSALTRVLRYDGRVGHAGNRSPPPGKKCRLLIVDERRSRMTTRRRANADGSKRRRHSETCPAETGRNRFVFVVSSGAVVGGGDSGRYSVRSMNAGTAKRFKRPMRCKRPRGKSTDFDERRVFRSRTGICRGRFFYAKKKNEIDWKTTVVEMRRRRTRNSVRRRRAKRTETLIRESHRAASSVAVFFPPTFSNICRCRLQQTYASQNALGPPLARLTACAIMRSTSVMFPSRHVPLVAKRRAAEDRPIPYLKPGRFVRFAASSPDSAIRSCAKPSV